MDSNYELVHECKQIIARWVMRFGFERYEFIISMIRLIVVYTIPCTALVLLNYLLYRTMKEAERRRNKLAQKSHWILHGGETNLGSTNKVDTQTGNVLNIPTLRVADVELGLETASEVAGHFESEIVTSLDEVESNNTNSINNTASLGEMNHGEPETSETKQDFERRRSVDALTSKLKIQNSNTNSLNKRNCFRDHKQNQTLLNSRADKDTSSQNSSLGLKPRSSIRTNRSSKNRRTTWMLIVMVTTFLIVEFPGSFMYNVIILISNIEHLQSTYVEHDGTLAIITNIVRNLESLMVVVGSSLNFPIVYLMSTEFRSTLHEMIRLKR